MTVIIGRSGWGALPPNRIAPPLTQCLEVVVHHSATGTASDILDAEAITLAIQRDHLTRTKLDGSLEFSDIAYNLLVGPDVVLLGRGLTQQGGATGNGYDDRTASICVIGNYQTDELGPAERRALVYGIQMIWQQFGPSPVGAHRDLYATSCPGDHLVAQLASIEQEAKDDEPMTPADIEALSTAIVDKFFAHPIELNAGGPPLPYPTTIQGWHVFMHQLMQRLSDKP